MEKLLCPSMMCADYGRLAEEIKALDEAGVDIFHCDIMDGTFVPNITMGLMDLKTIRKYTKKPVDVHLMIENPGEKVDWFLDAGADIVYIHPESERYVVKTLAHIKSRGAAAGTRHQHMDVAAQLAGCGHGVERGRLDRLVVVFSDNENGHVQSTFATFLSLSTNCAMSATSSPALRLGGSATFRVVRRGVTSTPRSAGL